MKRTLLPGLIAATMLAACVKPVQPPQKPETTACTGNSVLDMSVTYNNATATSHDDSYGTLRVIYMQGNNSVFLLHFDIMRSGQPTVGLHAHVDALNPSTGMYYADSADLTGAEFDLDTVPYHSKDFSMNISTLGNTLSSDIYATEYRQAAGSFSGTFISDSGKDTVHVSGHYCMDMP